MRKLGGTVLLAVLAATGLRAQGTGKLRLQIDPDASFVYRLDHQFTLRQSDLELLEGPHHLSIWAPERRIVDTTVTITPGKQQLLDLRLPYSTEYLVYQRDLGKYTKARRMQRLIPTAATAVSLAWTVGSYVQMKKAHDQLEDDRTAYDAAASPHAITVLKEQTMPAHKDDFAQARNRFGVAAGISVLCAGATAYLYWRTAKQPRPVFKDAEKLRFEGLSWMPVNGSRQWMGGLTWNFTR
jgi:hypothetical protein